MATTSIEWTDTVWNPTTGCDRVSRGCDNCYALSMAKRLKAMGQPKYQADGDPRTSGPGFGVTVHPDALDAPRGWAAPRRVFVNSMSDLFHPKVPVEFVSEVFAVIADTPRHQYQLLTKRPLRAARLAGRLEWPANLWVGASVEDADAAGRVEQLRRVPAAVRFLSLEPLLGPLGGLDLDGVDWVIVGGESGPGARPMELSWARELVAAAAAADVAVFVKQLGSVWARAAGADPKGGDWGRWPVDLRVRQMPGR